MYTLNITVFGCTRVCAIFLFLHSTHLFGEITLHKKFYTLTLTHRAVLPTVKFSDRWMVKRPRNPTYSCCYAELVVYIGWIYIGDRFQQEEKKVEKQFVRIKTNTFECCVCVRGYAKKWNLLVEVSILINRKNSAYVEPVHEAFAPFSFIGIILMFVCRLVQTYTVGVVHSSALNLCQTCCVARFLPMCYAMRV